MNPREYYAFAADLVGKETDYDMLDKSVEDHRTARKFVARAKQIIKKLDECEADPVLWPETRLKLRNWVGSAEATSKGFTLT